MPQEDSAHTQKRGDKFLRWPFIVAAALWPAVVLPIIFNEGGFFLHPSLWLPLAVVLATPVLAAVTIIILLATLRWRAALSVLAAVLVFFGTGLWAVRYTDELRFLWQRDYYEA